MKWMQLERKTQWGEDFPMLREAGNNTTGVSHHQYFKSL
jgi:hypothetical protein